LIIHIPEITEENGKICISSRVEVQDATTNFPEKLYFKFPGDHREFVTSRADGFAASLLLLAAALGEDMEIRGEFSPRLLHSMNEYLRIFNNWFPRRIKIIDIKCNNLKRQDENSIKGAVVSAFSGGVDSFYTLWSHLPKNETIPEYQVSHTLFIHGFDIPLEDEMSFIICKQAYGKLIHNLGLKFLIVQTNTRQFLGEKIDWLYAFGSALTGGALVLSGLISRLFIPASHSYSDLFPLGSHPLIDHLLSTETLEIYHDGATVSRFQKTKIISKWNHTYSNLRVCWKNPNGLANCCRCEKCIRTMVTLKLLGCLNSYTTFPVPLRRKNIYKCRFFGKSERRFALDIINQAVSIGRISTAFDLCCALFISIIIDLVKKIKNIVVKT